jgi:L-ascorbate metabolism protein UlaG (beta-lactamase superfamily)
LLDDGNDRVLLDPFLTGNALAGAKAEDITTDYLCVTHGHGDHLGDGIAIAKRCKAKAVCTADMADSVFGPAGIDVIAGNIGGTVRLPFGSVKFIQAIHGSGIPGGLPCGFLIEMGGKKIYHAGDTALMSDMALLAEEEIDVAILPIGDVFTMGPKDAVKAAKMIAPKLVIPMHYNTFPPIAQDPDAFAEEVKKAGIEARVLKPGETLLL